MTMKRIVVKRAYQEETVEIIWTLEDGTTYYERHICPPEETRKARLAKRLAKQDDKNTTRSQI